MEGLMFLALAGVLMTGVVKAIVALIDLFRLND